MNQCNECGSNTNNLETLQAGQMQVLCEDCKEELIESYESGTDNADESLDLDGPTVDGGSPIHTDWRVESIREEWAPLNVRLPDYLMRRFQSYHKRLDYELAKKGSTRDFGKDRHYKPLVIALGLNEVKEMNADELTEALRNLEKNQIVD